MGVLRIIAGRFRRRRILAPPTDRTRPITDRVRESLFAALTERVAGAAVADLFAGGGTLGLEAISRGASRCVFVERDAAALRALRANIETLAVADRCPVVRADLLRSAAVETLRPWGPFDLVFFDPPYAMWEDPQQAERLAETIRRLGAAGLPAADALLITRTDARSAVPTPAGFTLSDQRRYGRMLLWFFRPARAGGEQEPA
jgi:16S rRNA (guanine966-N2)-methyltransferase